ncbi:MAG: hypothetical protein JWO09_2740 [Bacteroidetes bacterium]|nr:hypothetical protein [Bacteroidota bacterium]
MLQFKSRILKTSVFLLCFLLIFSCSNEQGDKNGFKSIDSLSVKDSIFCNEENPEKDRIMFFNHDSFIWINERIVKKDTALYVFGGKYHLKNDTILFTSLDSENNSSDSLPSDGIYERVFKKKRTISTQIMEAGKFYAIKKFNSIELVQDHKKYTLKE